MNTDILDDEDATHVLTQIKWGANVNVVVEYKNEENEDIRQIAGSLQASLQKFSLNISGKGQVNYKEKSDMKNKKFSIRIYGDVVSTEEAPQTIEDAVKMVAKMPTLVQKSNDGMGRPITFYFTPMSKIQSHFQSTKQINNVICTLEEGAVLQFVQLFDEILTIKQNLNDFLMDLKKFQKYLPSQSFIDVSEFKTKFEIEEAKLKSSLADLLVEVRCGKKSISVLYQLVEKYKSNPYSASKVQERIENEFEMEIEKINLVRVLLSNEASICQRGQTLDHYVLQPTSNWLVLYYTKPQTEIEKDLWIQNRYLFLTCLGQQKKNDGNEQGTDIQNILTKNNPRVPSQETFSLDSIQDQYIITVMGKTLPDSKSFRLNLLDNDGSNNDTLLKYECDFDGKRTVVNSKEGSNWTGDEEFELQIKKDTFFRLQISRDTQGFKIEVEDGPEINYRHKFKSSATTLKLSLEGDVQLYLCKVDQIDPDDTLNSSEDSKKKFEFLFVDCDVMQDLIVPEGITIYRYESGKPITRNLYLENLQNSNKRLAKCSSQMTMCYKPNKRAFLEVHCPGSLSGQCKNGRTTWLCGKCQDQLEYGFNDYFYCSCGQGKAIDFLYKCDDASLHGEAFIKYPPDSLKFQLNEHRAFKELNILLLGATGVGKSTWINGFANYLTYKTLDEAQQKDMVCLIPCSFNMLDENFEEKEISVGKDSNESKQKGQSATQYPVSYTFPSDDSMIRIIDTPGIGDTRGIDQDKKNFEYIINHLSKLDEIHGILILIKPNEARLTILFEFCIKELLAHLHRDAIANIVFCFTNARSTFYRPGDTYTSLKALLNSDANKEIPKIPLGKHTIYCMDNEAVRFLAACKNGIEFDDNEKANYSASWTKAVHETDRLMEHIKGVKPHKTRDTVSLNGTRQTILKLAKPLATISQTIQLNIAVLEDREKDLQNADIRSKDLRSKLHVPGINLEKVTLSYPKTVCANPKCTESIEINTTSSGKSISTTNYKQVCHSPCGISGLVTNQMNIAQLQGCACMHRPSPSTCVCRHCGCSWEVHMHITYDTKQVSIQVKQTNIENDLNKNESAKQEIARIITECKERKMLLEGEQGIINVAAAKFAIFLKNNAITPYNDALARYMDHMIALEEEKVTLKGSRATLDGLLKNREVYTAEIEILKGSMERGEQENVTIDEINKLLKSLYDLKINGPTIKDLLDTANKSDKLVYIEKPYQPNKKTPSQTSSYSRKKQKQNQPKGVFGRVKGYLGF